MDAPRIVFCTTCKGRESHLAETLPINLADNADYENCAFVVLDYGASPAMKTLCFSIASDLYASYLADSRLVFYSYPGGDKFRMAHAKNMAHRCGLLEGADILVNLDADNFTGPGFASYVAEKFTSNDNTFLWANRNQPAPIRYPKGCNGRIAVTSAAFLKTGGYNEAKYNQWGPDDKDFHYRLRRFGYDACEIPRQYLNVILHNDKMRFREYREAKRAAQYEGFQSVDESATVANWGQFGMGQIHRNFDFSKSIELGPVPTRIFGIGMHKTGTTSLHAALKLLGYDSGHWKSVAWAKRIWDEMRSSGRSRTLERHYALSDLPIPLLFRELDKAYPGSKFILTLRNEKDWIRSVKNHWTSLNQWRDTWNKEGGFPEQIHEELYGQSGFNAEIFIQRFRRHNAEVLDYFRGRPGDLLIMDMDKGAGWAELCGFLRVSVPEVEYPKSNPGPFHPRSITSASSPIVIRNMDWPVSPQPALPPIVAIDTPKRSIFKALTYRILGSICTWFIVLLLTRNSPLSLDAGLLDFAIKTAAYFAHERVWDRFSFGRRTVKAA